MSFVWFRHFRYVFVAYVHVFVSQVECCFVSWLSPWFCLLRCSGSCLRQTKVGKNRMNVCSLYTFTEFYRHVYRYEHIWYIYIWTTWWRHCIYIYIYILKYIYIYIHTYICCIIYMSIYVLCIYIYIYIYVVYFNYMVKLAVAISRKERLCLTPVQSFESNVCAMRFKKVTSETPLGRCIFKTFTKCRF